ncbi:MULTISPECIES: hypothetical protein [Thiomicrorhabdus]|uniref:Uncharacterized protein n=1 Tax=Thiomicrorhabdus heinhorstiae TaxID=2748010 RepID=A0ABS0BVP4_9GAMM|nr:MULTISPECIES: hypothetical protein [Thiomicrorhabdus]MBF6057029.1 hypothetical protein [Thiomicrorhabdus heinhorstiae]
MSVLVEGYSIIINKEKAQQNPKALEALQKVQGNLHPMAICADQNLLRIGFLRLEEMQAFGKQLIEGGLQERVEVNGEVQAGDMVLVTQFGELEVICPWLQIGFQKMKDGTLICLASLKPAQAQQAAFPKGWTLEDSILQSYYEGRMAYMDENYDRIDEDPSFMRFKEKGGDKVVKLVKLHYSQADVH